MFSFYEIVGSGHRRIGGRDKMITYLLGLPIDHYLKRENSVLADIAEMEEGKVVEVDGRQFAAKKDGLR